MRTFASIFTLCFLSACAFNNTGQIDYRVATNDPSDTSDCSTSPDANSRCVALDRRYSLSDYRYDQPFSTDDVYSINIEQMVIGEDISESHHFKGIDKSGEFVVLANVFEFASTSADAQQRSFVHSDDLAKQTSTDQRLKLVHYDDGIQASQPFNFSNIPIVPRSQYKGGSIGIQLVVLELDTQEGPMTSLLTTLARVGQKAIPVSPAVTDVILDLGESLFQGGTYDDRLFEYRFVLSNGEEAHGNVSAVFASGRYVLRRKEDRTTEIEWSKAKLDLNTGRLRDEYGAEIRDDLYIVLNIAKYDPATAVEFYDSSAWNEFRQALVDSDPGATSLEDLKDKLEIKLIEQRSDDWLRKLKLAWSQAEAKLNRYSRASVAVCEAPDPTRAARSRDEAEFAANDALRKFETSYQQIADKGEAGQPKEFNSEDTNSLVSRVARYFMPWNSVGDPQEHFSRSDKFNAYLANGLRAGAIEVARKRGIASACANSRTSELPVETAN